MPLSLSSKIDQTVEQAKIRGALKIITTSSKIINDQGYPFCIRCLTQNHQSQNLYQKQRSSHHAHSKNYSPFNPPEAELLISEWAKKYYLILNKYPIMPKHLLIVTKAPINQLTPLILEDFQAACNLVNTLGGLIFFNAGKIAGASQLHKHLQWIPYSEGDTPKKYFQLNPDFFGRVPWKHYSIQYNNNDVRTECDPLYLFELYLEGMKQLNLCTDSYPISPFNLLFNHKYLIIIPRQQECYQNISINALGFIGSLFVKTEQELTTIENTGPCAILAKVGFSLS